MIKDVFTSKLNIYPSSVRTIFDVLWNMTNTRLVPKMTKFSKSKNNELIGRSSLKLFWKFHLLIFDLWQYGCETETYCFTVSNGQNNVNKIFLFLFLTSFQFANELVRLNYSRVCFLHRGIDVFRSTGLITLPQDDMWMVLKHSFWFC